MRLPIYKLSDETNAFLLHHVNHPELVTIYPPFAQLVFALGSLLSGSVIGMKTVLVVMDIATCIRNGEVSVYNALAGLACCFICMASLAGYRNLRFRTY